MRANRRTIVAILATLLCGVGISHVARADDDDRHSRDHDLARQALERGEVLPLEAILAEVRKAVPGEVVGVELEHEHGAWQYEVKIVAPGGVLSEVKVDARTGRLLRIKGK